MLEKIILAIAITFSVNFFLAVNSQSGEVELLLGENQTGTLSAVDRHATTDIPLIASAVEQK